MRRAPTTLLVILLLPAFGAACSSPPPDSAAPPTVATQVTASAEPSAAASPTASSPKPVVRTSSPAPAAAWPASEDCFTYDPAAITVNYAAGIYSINAGSQVVMRLHGAPGTDLGDKGKALAQRFRKHCFIGRDNTRSEPNAYVFDYWRSPSGMTPTIAGQSDDCSSYDRNNLTVEDMGVGNGWRVKNHDQILHLFDNESDARDGKLVLSKYRRICFLGDNDLDDPDLISYSL